MGRYAERNFAGGVAFVAISGPVTHDERDPVASADAHPCSRRRLDCSLKRQAAAAERICVEVVADALPPGRPSVVKMG